MDRQEPLYFANSALFKDRLKRVEMFGALGVHPGEERVDRPFRTVVIDCERMTTIDARCAVGDARTGAASAGRPHGSRALDLGWGEAHPPRRRRVR